MHQGIKGNSVFNKLFNFHLCQPGLPPCLAHNLFDCDIAMCLQILIKMKKWFSYKSLNDRLKSFPGESSHKPNAIPNKGVLVIEAIVAHDRIEETDSAIRQLVLLLRELAEFVCAPRLSDSQIAYMKVLICDKVQGVCGNEASVIPTCKS